MYLHMIFGTFWNSIDQIFLIVGSIQGLILFFFLFFKTRHSIANGILGLIILLMSVQLFFFSIDEIYNHIGCALTHISSRLIFLVYGPLFFFYTRQIVLPGNKLKWRDFYHFFPFFCFSIICYWSYQRWVVDQGEGWIHYLANTHYFHPWFYESLRLFHLLCYLFFSIRILNRYKMNSSSHNMEGYQLKWLGQLLIVALITWVIVTLGLRLNYFSGNPNQFPYQFVFMSISIFFYWITYKSLSQPEIYQVISTNPSTIGAIKYKNSGFNKSMAPHLITQLKAIMESDKPYLQADLKL